MNKNAIKKFAIEARQKLIASVTDKAGMLGITAEGVSAPTTKGNDFEVYQTAAGTEVTLNKKQCEQRRRLVEQIETKGFEEVVEEVAYTWFNRICAIRFMEVNDYLPSRVRTLSSEKEGKNEPDLVTQATDVDLDLTDAEKEFVIESKMSGKLDELFAMLFVKQCNKLHEVLPELFEETSDYTEMLLSISFTNKDDVIRMLIDEVPEEDFNITTTDENGNVPGQVEIIGWLYQYYNTELKDDTFAKLKKNIKITKERIPAATQLFTPDWIVRYMVENSVGRLWIEHLRAVDPSLDEKKTAEEFGWKYYLPEAEQEESVNKQLATIRADYINMTPEDIACIDPCMGSGHILVAMFDVLMDIYKSVGYSERDAALFIVQKNIHGLDIDKRACQLAYFAVMMKGRQYNRRFLRYVDDAIKPMVCTIEESNHINKSHLKYFGATLDQDEKAIALNQVELLIKLFLDAKEYGSILYIESLDWNLLERFCEYYNNDNGQMTLFTIGIDDTQRLLKELIRQASIMSSTYHAVITNPPYMGSKGMNSKLLSYIQNNYNTAKTDIFACFIQKGLKMLKKGGINAQVTMQVWMFLTAFDKFREELFSSAHIISLLHMDNMVMGIAFGTSASIIRNGVFENYNAQYSYVQMKDLGRNDFPETFPVVNDRFTTSKISDIRKIPRMPVAYWASPENMNAYVENKPLSAYADVKKGMSTADDKRFLRLWHEVEKTKFQMFCPFEEAKWFSLNKGGSFRRWYGNNEYVVNWENDGFEMKNFKKSVIRNPDYYFKDKALTWTYVTNYKLNVRYYEKAAFAAVGPGIFPKSLPLEYILGLLNSDVAQKFADNVGGETITYEVGEIASIPVKVPNDNIIQKVVALVKQNITMTKKDWDDWEVSCDFSKHPLLQNKNIRNIQSAFVEWNNTQRSLFSKLKENEVELNKLFGEIYGLLSEIAGEILDKDISIRMIDQSVSTKSLLSYAVGCMFGRYSLDDDGLQFAGGIFDMSKYEKFIPDADNIIPITDEEYFSDDIVGRLCEWLKITYGNETLEENLQFIADSLGNKGKSSRDVIRNYFINDFYNDHVKMYQKRPIYWMFDSGKEDGFKALIYMHRYTADTVGTVRTDYLHKTQKAIEQAMQREKYASENALSASDKKKAVQKIAKYTKQLAQMKSYDEAMAHIANQRIEIDLDDGVKVNYEKFQGLEVAQEGKKALKIDLLVKIK